MPFWDQKFRQVGSLGKSLLHDSGQADDCSFCAGTSLQCGSSKPRIVLLLDLLPVPSEKLAVLLEGLLFGLGVSWIGCLWVNEYICCRFFVDGPCCYRSFFDILAGEWQRDPCLCADVRINVSYLWLQSRQNLNCTEAKESLNRWLL